METNQTPAIKILATGDGYTIQQVGGKFQVTRTSYGMSGVVVMETNTLDEIYQNVNQMSPVFWLLPRAINALERSSLAELINEWENQNDPS